jgi:hypothetical protein
MPSSDVTMPSSDVTVPSFEGTSLPVVHPESKWEGQPQDRVGRP